MGYGRGEKIERHFDGKKAHSKERKTMKFRTLAKKWKRQRERRRAKIDPECQNEYRKYGGWEY